MKERTVSANKGTNKEPKGYSKNLFLTNSRIVKGLEPENIKKIKAWNKKFTSKFDEDELKTVLRLSESIDKLWKLTADERKKIEEATYEPLSVYGHEESGEGSHKSIREKDEIYKKLFKSENCLLYTSPSPRDA